MAFLPAFKESGVITINGTPGEIKYSTPCVHDWNGDGKKDLISGQYDSGWVNLLINTGTNESPRFTSRSYLKAGGQRITFKPT